MTTTPSHELELKTYSHRWTDLSIALNKLAGDCGIHLEIVAIPRGFFRFYHCVASGQRDGLELFKSRWAESKKPVKLRR